MDADPARLGPLPQEVHAAAAIAAEGVVRAADEIGHADPTLQHLHPARGVDLAERRVEADDDRQVDPFTLGEAESVVFEVQVAEVEAEAGEEAPAEESVPALGTDKLCLVTATFYDAGGVPVQGVLVRFSPTILAEQNSPFGFIAREVTAQSDADGELAMYLVRGMTGTVSVTGVAIVRQVEVPDVGTAGLFDLISASQDPLEVQNLDAFVQLPRSS